MRWRESVGNSQQRSISALAAGGRGRVPMKPEQAGCRDLFGIFRALFTIIAEASTRDRRSEMMCGHGR